MRTIRLAAIVAAAAVLWGSGLALAATDGGDDDAEAKGDSATLFTYGYDPVSHVLVTGVNLTGDAVDCALDGPYEVVYVAAEDGTIAVGPIPGAEACVLEAILVAGPNGQINHGQVVSALSRAIDIAGKGCVMRWIAASGFGKGDQQVRTSDVDPVFAPLDMGTIDLATVMAACHAVISDDAPNGAADAAKDRVKDKAKDMAKGKAAPGQPESPGNSANAPGHNK